MDISPATLDDFKVLFDLINEAYEVETGDSGVAFKKTLRLVGDSELTGHLTEGRTLKAVDTTTGATLGCIVWDVSADGRACHFGPFAVAKSAQGRGVGTALIEAVRGVAVVKGCAVLAIEVVNHRTDILPMYRAKGFVEVGTGDFPAPDRLTRPCHFILMEKPL